MADFPKANGEKTANDQAISLPINDDEAPPPLVPKELKSTREEINTIEDIDMTDDERRLREEPIDHEINVGDFDANPQASQVASVSKRGARSNRAPRTNNQEIDPRWHEPFFRGWKREIVQRGSLDPSKRTFDTYYFAPEGKKLRSVPEILKHLENTGETFLTKDNFTFAKRVIYKEPFEALRMANPGRGGPGKGRGTGTGHVPDSPHSLDGSPRNETNSPRGRGARGRGKGSRGRGKKRERGSDSESSTTSSLGSYKSDKDLLFSGLPAWDSYHGQLSSESFQREHKKDKHKKYKKDESGSFDTSAVVDLTDDPLTPGNTSATSEGSSNYETPGGLLVKKGPVAKKRTAPRIKPNTISDGNSSRWSSPEKQLKTNSSVQEQTRLCGLACPGREGLAPTLHCKTCMMLFHPQCVNVVDTPLTPARNFICNTCKNRTPVKQALTPSGAVVPKLSPKPTSDDVSTVDLSKIINQNQVSGQLLTLPPGVLNHLDLSQPLALKVNNKVLMIPPNCFISSDLAVKVFLPPGTLPNTLFKEKNLPINFNFYAKNNEQILNFTEPGDSSTKDQGPEEGDKENFGKLSRKQLKVSNPNECHFMKLHSGYDCMLSIFRYLSVAELLRAARVCRTWAKVSSQDALWKLVRLKGSRVYDWEQAARRFKNHMTWSLDLRGMVLCDDHNRTWHQFMGVLENLHQLRHISFGQSPACILHAVVEKLDKLEVLNAESVTEMLPEARMWTTNTKIDIGKFANLKTLEQLRLRGVCGLVLPAFSFTGGLTELSALTNLKTLVLTTLRNIPDSDFLFLKSLINLEILEIGDCVKWNAQVYQQLAELTKLKSLRLECGGETPQPALGEALKPLTALEKLELVKFAVDVTMGDALKCLTKLSTLSIWPDTTHAALNNTNTLNAVRELKTLKSFGWGIMADNGSVVLRPEGGEGEKMVECLSFQDEDAEKQDGEKHQEKFVSLSKLVEELGVALPDTKIKVLKVPLTQGPAEGEKC